MKCLTIILLFIYTNLFAQFEPDSTFVLLRFNEPMDSTDLFLIENYKVVGSSGDTLEIFSIGNIEGLDTAVVILAGRQSYNSNYYTVYANNVKDTSGNVINFQKRFAFYDFKMKNIQMANSVGVEKDE